MGNDVFNAERGVKSDDLAALRCSFSESFGLVPQHVPEGRGAAHLGVTLDLWC